MPAAATAISTNQRSGSLFSGVRMIACADGEKSHPPIYRLGAVRESSVRVLRPRGNSLHVLYTAAEK